MKKLNFLVKNINSYTFLIFLIIIFEFFKIFENLFGFYWVVSEFWKRKKKNAPTGLIPNPTRPTLGPNSSIPTGLGRVAAKPPKMDPS